MTVLHNKKQNSVKHSRRRMQVIGSVTCIAAGAVVHSLSGWYIKTPRNNSRLSCPQWVQELLDGHRDRFRDVHRLNRHVFEKLLDELKEKQAYNTRGTYLLKNNWQSSYTSVLLVYQITKLRIEYRGMQLPFQNMYLCHVLAAVNFNMELHTLS